MDQIKLTQYSHGAGCGCKISPKVLKQILSSQTQNINFPKLLVGNESSDDAAVYEIENAKKLNEDRLDKVFFNYLDNLESDIKSKDYWKQRFFE